MENRDRLMRHSAVYMVNLLIKATEVAGIKILFNKPVASIEKKENRLLIRTGAKPGTESKTQSSRTEIVMHGAGRVPNNEDLQLEKVGVKVGKGAVVVDKYADLQNASSSLISPRSAFGGRLSRPERHVCKLFFSPVPVQV